MSVRRMRRSSRTNRKISLLIAAGILMVGVFQITRAADTKRTLSTRVAERESIRIGGVGKKRSAKLDVRLDGIEDQISDLQLRMIQGDELEGVQADIMKLAKKYDLNLNRSLTSTPTSMSWDDALRAKDESQADNMYFDDDESPFELISTQLSLGLEGGTDSLLKFLEEVEQRKWIFDIAEANFSRKSDGEDLITLQMILVFQDLIEVEIEEDEWDEEPPPP